MEAIVRKRRGNWYVAMRGYGATIRNTLRDMQMLLLYLASDLLVQSMRPLLRTFILVSPAIWLCGRALFYF
jgi:hypothetical protein